MDRASALDAIRAGWRDIPADQSFVIETMRPEDAPGICRLVYAVYGDKYPIDGYYDPDWIADSNANGDMVTLVARTPTGDIVGQGAIWCTSSPNRHLFECGQFIVLPAYRGTRIAAKLGFMSRDLADSLPQVHALFGEPVTNHVVTQKACRLLKAPPSVVELALMPAGAYAGEGAGQTRVTCLMATRMITDTRRPLHLPACYRAALAPVVADLRLDRDLAFGNGTAPAPDVETAVTVQDFGEAGTVRCHVTALGADFPDRLAALTDKARADGRAVVEVFLPADTAAGPWAAIRLRSLGYCLAGLAPLWLGPDALVMQRLFVTPDFDAIQLLDDIGRDLLNHVRADWEDRSRADVSCSERNDPATP
jgi:hypothetical protein